MPRPRLVAILLAALTLAAGAQPTPPPGFTYQGRVKLGGAPLDQPTQARFRLFASPDGADQVGPTLAAAITPDADGVFTTTLDFGVAFGPEPRYLEVSLADPENLASFIPLLPRTPVQPVPLAQHALSAPIPTLAQVSDNLFSHEPGGHVDLATGDSFQSGLRLFNNIDKGLTLSRPGIQSTLDLTVNTSENLELRSTKNFSLRATAGQGAIQTQTILELLSGMTLKLQAQANITATAPVVNIAAAATLSLDGSIVDIDAGTVFVNGHVFMNNHAVLLGLLQATNAALSGNLQVGGSASKPGGGPWAALSDARTKKNVQALPGSLDLLNALRPVSFEYKDPDAPHTAPGTFLGFLAQEVRPVLPHWVTETSDGTLMLTPQGFEALTVRAIQELDANHRAATARLQAENAELKARLDALEHALARLAAPKD